MTVTRAAALGCTIASLLGNGPALAAQVQHDSVAQDSVRNLPPIVVTSTRGELGGLAAPLPAAEISGRDLREETSVSLARAVERLPGLRTLSTGEQVGKPVIRGLSGPRVLVLDNGSRLEDQSWSDEDGPSVDVRLTERIEVIRGPASVLYGSDAIGGVVNVRPATLPRAEPGSSSSLVRTELYGASNNAEAGLIASADGARGRLGGRLTLIGRRGADLHTPAGELPNTGFSALNGEAAAALHGDRGSTVVRYTRSGGEFKLLEAGGSGAGDNPEAEEGGPERQLSDDRLQVTSNHLAGRVGIEGRAQWQRHWMAEQSDELPMPGSGTGEGRVFELALNTWTADLLVRHALSSRVSGTVGLSGLYQTNDTRGPIPLVPDATVRGLGLYALERVELGRWAALAGVRGDVRGIRAAGAQAALLVATARDFSDLTADLGVVFRPASAFTLSANVGRAWRAPNLFELFANGPRLGEARYDVGDPTLGPESSLNLDLGVRWGQEFWRGEISVYRNRIADFIFAAPTPDFADSLRIHRYARTNAVLRGFEAEVQVDILPRLSVGGRADYTEGTDLEADLPIPQIPPLRGVIEAELHSLDLGWLQSGHIGAEVQLVGHQGRLGSYQIPGSSTTVVDVPTEGYALVGLELGGERRLAGRRLELSFRARNLLNAEYRDYLSRYKEFALNPGRNLSLRMAMEW